jgi:exonuclease VII small subunit
MRKTICICDKCKKELKENEEKLIYFGANVIECCEPCYKELQDFKNEINILRKKYNKEEKGIIKKYHLEDIL